MNRFMSMVAIISFATFNVGCASASGSDYYEAVRKTAEAQALASEARYRALAQVAQSGDGQAAAAAVMAIALTQDKTIAPQYVESSALKWAQVLTPTVGTLGLGFIQADVAKNASDNAMQVKMASFASNEAIQLGQQQMVTDLGGQWSATASAGGAAVVELGLAGFNALNIAGDQTVEMGVAGLNTADSIATTGLTTTGDVATAGFAQIGATAETGINAVATVGTTGINSAVELGQWGMEGIWTTNQDWLNYSETRDTNFSTILTDFNATLQQFGTDLGTPITCQDDGTGDIVCN